MRFARANRSGHQTIKGLARKRARPFVVISLTLVASGYGSVGLSQVDSDPHPGEIQVELTHQLLAVTPKEITGTGKYPAVSHGT